MDGSFADLNADSIGTEVEDYSKEIYKIQKVFFNRLKKMQAHRDEKEEERKRKKNRKSVAVEVGEDGSPVSGSHRDEPLPQVVPPAAIQVCAQVLEQMDQFKVCAAHCAP